MDPRLFWLPISEALMIGVLVGAQREHSKLSPNLGIREFVLAAALGTACGIQQNPALSAAALVALIVALIAFRVRTPSELSGLTTDLSMLAVFCLSHVCAMSQSENIREAVIGIAVAITFLLESKDKVRRFFRKTLRPEEFSGTLLFLALVFIIYPILPEGSYGPYNGFSPRDIWIFVILVSFVSFGGYFLEKYMGASSGLKVTAVLGGIASTTATTLALSKEARLAPEKLNTYWQAGTLTNAIQFPRLFCFLSIISPQISADAALPLLAAGGAGIVMAMIIPFFADEKEKARMKGKDKAATDSSRPEESAAAAAADQVGNEAEAEDAGSQESVPESVGSNEEGELESRSGMVLIADSEDSDSQIRNPLTLGPALKCGLVLAIVVFINKVVVTTMGAAGLIYTSIIGGLVDVDAIAVSAADLFRDGQIVPDRAVGSVLLAVCMNAVFKTGITISSGSPAFAAKMAISFSVMLAVATLTLHFI